MACYRAGRYEEAREVFDEVFKARDSGYVFASLVQAMNYHALNRPELAHASFDRGVRRFTSIKSSLPENDYGEYWRNWIYSSVLENEARQVLNLQPTQDQVTEPE